MVLNLWPRKLDEWCQASLQLGSHPVWRDQAPCFCCVHGLDPELPPASSMHLNQQPKARYCLCPVVHARIGASGSMPSYPVLHAGVPVLGPAPVSCTRIRDSRPHAIPHAVPWTKIGALEPCPTPPSVLRSGPRLPCAPYLARRARWPSDRGWIWPGDQRLITCEVIQLLNV